MPSTRGAPPRPALSTGAPPAPRPPLPPPHPPPSRALHPPRRADRAAERVQGAAGLFHQLAADAHVAGNGVLVVELIGPERAGLLQQAVHLLSHAIEERRRDAAAVARDDDEVAAEGA